MSGDYSKWPDYPRKRFNTLLRIQGSLDLDHEANEHAFIRRRIARNLAEDVFGSFGIPQLTSPGAFQIGHLPGIPEDLSIGEGRVYLAGRQVEHFIGEGATYLSQPFLPLPADLPAGAAVVSLRVWDREISYIEDRSLLEVALMGVNTATRIQTVWQVLVDPVDEAECGADVGLVSAGGGRLSTAANAPPAPDDPCVVPPLTGYRGPENRNYLVKIFEGGALGNARFAFSREGGSIVAAVEQLTTGVSDTTLIVDRIGRDPIRRFVIGDWVWVTDDVRELMLLPPEPAQIDDVDEADRRIVLDRVLPAHDPTTPFGANSDELRARHTKIIRWDQTGEFAPIDTQGLITTGPGPITIGDGIELSFSEDPAGGSFLTGDSWLFCARAADASVETLVDAPPREIYHVVQLAAANGLGTPNPQITDCRPSPPETEAQECCCCEITVSPNPEDGADFESLAAAVAAMPTVEPNEEIWIVICLLAGEHPLEEAVEIRRQRVILRGCGPGTILRAQQPALTIGSRAVIVEDLAIEGRTEGALVFLSGEELELTRLRVSNAGQGPAIRALRVERLRLERLQIRARGGVALEGSDMALRDSALSQGPVVIGGGSERVSIHDNELADSSAEGIILGENSVIFEIELSRNRILRAARSAIASGHFDPENEGGDGIVDGLSITDNQILDCISPEAEREAIDPPFAGIALGRVYDLAVRDNRVLRNGEASLHPVCGIYVRHSRGVEISRNRIERNGSPTRPSANNIAAPADGVRAGIALMDARAAMAARRPGDPDDQIPGFAELAAAAAAHVSGNAVSAPRGHALRIVGQGPMRILDNRFQARVPLGIRQGEEESVFGGAEGLIATVFIANFGWPSWIGTLGAALGFDLLTGDGIEGLEGSEVLGAITAGGHTQYRGNQVRLDLTQPDVDVFLANQFVAALDDTLITGNQSEGIFTFLAEGGGIAAPDPSTLDGPAFVNPTLESDAIVADLLLADLYNIGLTTRQTDNGLMTAPLLTIYSLLSVGIINHCTHNQTTSCIEAIGSSPKSVVSGNAVLWPHPVFCPDRPQ